MRVNLVLFGTLPVFFQKVICLDLLSKIINLSGCGSIPYQFVVARTIRNHNSKKDNYYINSSHIFIFSVSY
jgi:hypothetical protein